VKACDSSQQEELLC
ncbi:unnamed protein product, partial [Allacma fusca]